MRIGVSKDTELAQSALYALTMLVVRFGASPDGWGGNPPPELTDILATMLEDVTSEPVIISNAAVCFGAVCVARGPAVVEAFPRVMPALTSRMKQAADAARTATRNRGDDEGEGENSDEDDEEEEDEDEEEEEEGEEEGDDVDGLNRRAEWRQLLQCSAAAASTVVSVAPQFVGPYLKDLLVITAGEAFSDTRSSSPERAAAAVYVRPFHGMTSLLGFNAFLKFFYNESEIDECFHLFTFELSLQHMTRNAATSGTKHAHCHMQAEQQFRS